MKNRSLLGIQHDSGYPCLGEGEEGMLPVLRPRRSPAFVDTQVTPAFSAHIELEL